MKAYAHFNNDPSVGIASTYYELDLPCDRGSMDDDELEIIRKEIKDDYTKWDGEFECSYVMFDFELDALQND